MVASNALWVFNRNCRLLFNFRENLAIPDWFKETRITVHIVYSSNHDVSIEIQFFSRNRRQVGRTSLFVETQKMRFHQI